jgi:hypothetical protein
VSRRRDHHAVAGIDRHSRDHGSDVACTAIRPPLQERPLGFRVEEIETAQVHVEPDYVPYSDLELDRARAITSSPTLPYRNWSEPSTAITSALISTRGKPVLLRAAQTHR